MKNFELPLKLKISIDWFFNIKFSFNFYTCSRLGQFLWVTLRPEVNGLYFGKVLGQNVLVTKIWVAKSEVMILTFMFGRTFMPF